MIRTCYCYGNRHPGIITEVSCQYLLVAREEIEERNRKERGFKKR